VKTFEKAAFEKDSGKAMASLKIVSVGVDGKTVVEATRTYPPEMKGMMGTYIPHGDEAPERGRNPGSAEPGPDMPRYIFLCDGEKRTRIAMLSTARTCDTLWELPSAKAEKYLFFQVANEGWAGRGEPHVWLGQLDAAGKRSEKDLGNPFAKTVDGPMFDLLEIAPDASKATVLMRAQRVKTIPKKLDDATRKQIEEQLKSGKVQAASINGQEGVIQMLASGLLYQKYERAGGGEDREGNLTMMFQTWQVWELDAAKQSIKAVTPEFGEAIGELENIVGMPGGPGARWQTSAAFGGGWMAINLLGQNRQMKQGDDWQESRGLMLVRVK
jgi:hypothetical protein